MQIRSFCNADPPGIAAVWRSQPLLRGRFHGLTPGMWDELVAGRLYFQPNELLVGVESGRIVGFVHAAFSSPASEAVGARSTEGIVCQLMVEPRDDAPALGKQLLEAAENYLRERGARLVRGGAAPPDSHFYLGLYGGADLPGVLESDALFRGHLERAGYVPARERLIMQGTVRDYRPPMDRRYLDSRRTLLVEREFDPLPADARQAGNFGRCELQRFRVYDKSRRCLGETIVWDIDPLPRGWGRRVAGVVHFRVVESHRRQGVATFLIAEAIRQLQPQRFDLVEVHIPADDAAAMGLAAKLNLQRVESGTVYQKALA